MLIYFLEAYDIIMLHLIDMQQGLEHFEIIQQLFDGGLC
jgi:hypothetical protein